MNPYINMPCEKCGALNRVLIEKMNGKPRCAACKAQLDMGVPVNVNMEQFPRVVLESGLPVLADFWAPWCGPCRSMGPVLEELAHKHQQGLLVVKINVDEAPELAQRYGIRGVPTLILFQEGQERLRQVGAVPAPALESMINQARM